MRRIVPIALSFCLVMTLGMVRVNGLFAQEAAKKEAAKSEPPKKDEAKPAPAEKKEAAKTEPAKKEEAAEKSAEVAPPTIPPEVEAKLEAARHAVAEAIVAAQDAGLVESSIDPPPILDILIKGYALDARTLKNPAAKKNFWALTPEVFCGWFTGYGKLEGVNINPQNDIRIVNPSAGLKQWYDQRASMLNRHIEMVRKAKGPAATPKKEETKKEEPKKEETKKEEPKKEEIKKEEPKKEEAKKK